MLASPANPLSATDSQGRTANLLTLHVVNSKFKPVLLSPGKWNVGSAASNQIALDGGAPRQFLIIVTEHRSVIKDWSGEALWNGDRFDDAVLHDGDTVQVADIQLVFRLAKSLDLISQLPCVADRNGSDESMDVAENNIEVDLDDEWPRSQGSCHPGTENTSFNATDYMADFDDGPDRLDDLISRIGTTLDSESTNSVDASTDNAEVEFGSHSSIQHDGPTFESDSLATDDSDTSQAASTASLTLGQQATHIDDELRQLEELRAAVQLEREQLVAKRELLVRETKRVQTELEELHRGGKPPTVEQQNISLDDDCAEAGDCVFSNDADCADEELSSCVEHGDESFGNLVANPEDATVKAEREKLRHYLEKFNSVDDAEADENAEFEETVSVGAVQLATDYSVSNALRSREDAVKRLDELVLAATRGQGLDETSIGNRTPAGSGNHRALGTSLRTAGQLSEETTTVNELNNSGADNGFIPGAETVDIEESFEDLGALLNQAEQNDFEQNEQPPEDAQASVAGLESSELNPNLEEISDNGSSEVTDEHDCEARVDSEVDGNITLAAEADMADERLIGDKAYESASINENVVDNLLALQNPDNDELVVEPVFGDTDSESNVSLVDAELSESESGPTTGFVSSESEQQTDGEPSWFDSRFMTDGDAATGGNDAYRVSECIEPSPSDQMVSEEDRSEADESDEDNSASELRLKLAAMFDLPARPRHVSRVLPDSSQKTRSPQSHGRDGEDTADNVDSSEDSLRQKNVIRISDHDADDDAFPVVSVSSETKAGLEFESETLDEFPSPNREELDSEDEPDSETSSSFVPEDTSEEEVSISVYMERLLARNRQVTSARTSNSEPRGSEKKPHASGGLSIGASNEAATTKTGNAASVSKPETWFADTPRHRQNRDKVRADVQVLRQVANQSARSAVASASRRDVRKQVIVKTAASTLALGSGVAALLLDVSMLFGLVVLGIGLVFAVDLTLTIFRNWNQRRSLRNSAAAVKRKDKENAGATTSDDSPVLVKQTAPVKGQKIQPQR